MPKDEKVSAEQVVREIRREYERDTKLPHGKAPEETNPLENAKRQFGVQAGAEEDFGR